MLPEKLLKILIPGVHTNATEPESIIVSEPADTCLGTRLEPDTFTIELERLKLKREHDLTTDNGKVCQKSEHPGPSPELPEASHSL